MDFDYESEDDGGAADSCSPIQSAAPPVPPPQIGGLGAQGYLLDPLQAQNQDLGKSVIRFKFSYALIYMFV
jgi:hypothetical protein